MSGDIVVRVSRSEERDAFVGLDWVAQVLLERGLIRVSPRVVHAQHHGGDVGGFLLIHHIEVDESLLALTLTNASG